MFSKKNRIPLIIFAISATVLLSIIGIRSNIFQSSLIQSGSGDTLSTSTGDLMTATVDDATDITYRTTLLNRYQGTPGIYFPHVYKLPEIGSRVDVPVAYLGKTPLVFSSQLTFTLSYPTYLSYVGETSYTTDNAVVSVENNPDNRSLTYTLTSLQQEPTILPQDVSAIVYMPFNVSSDTATNGKHVFALQDAYTLDVAGQKEQVDFASEVVGLFTDVTLQGQPADQSNGSSREVITGEANRGVVTAEPQLGNSNGNTNGISTAPTEHTPTTNQAETTKAASKPIVTVDQTRVSPKQVVEGSEDTVFVYVSVSDVKGPENIQAVLLDLSSFGLGEHVPMVLLEKDGDYHVYATSFIMPKDVVAATEPKTITYDVVNKDGLSTKGELLLQVVAAESSSGNDNVNSSVDTTSTSSTEASIVNIDLNNDGVVNSDDLELFLNIYQKLSK